jgi:hypothetical protein
VAGQGRNLLAAVAAKEDRVGQWRDLSRRAHAQGAAPELKQRLAALGEQVKEADARIRVVARPQKLRFEVAPVQ